MRIGIIGLGHIGLPIATFLHSKNHLVSSWTRKEKLVPWEHSINLKTLATSDLDFLIVASGSSRPAFGDNALEISSTLGLISDFNFSISTKIVYISSGSVYGECSTPISEIEQPAPTSPYGKAKLAAEQGLSDLYGDQLTSLRVGNVVDTLQPYGILKYIKEAVSNNILDLYGNPSDCRDFMGVSDFLLVIEALLSLEEFPTVLNVGSGKSIELRKIEKLLTSNLNGQLSVKWNERRPGDLAQTRIDISRMRDLLGVDPIDPIVHLTNFISNINSIDHASN